MVDSIRDIIIRIVAQSEGFENFNTASSSLNQMSTGLAEAEASASNFGIGLEGVNEANASFADRLSASASGLEKFGSFGHTAMSIMDRLQISEMNTANAQMALSNAQIQYNSALEKFGSNSQQAIIAHNQLERASNNVEKANLREEMSMAMIGLTAVGEIPAIINFGKWIQTTMAAAQASTLAFEVRLKALAPELLVVGAVAGGLYYMMTQQAAAAQEASQQMTDTLSAGFDNANNEAQKLKSTIDEIQNSMKSSGMKAEQRTVEYQSTVEAVSQNKGLSPAEKNKQLGDLRLKYEEDIMRINLDESKLAWDKASTEEQTAKAKKEYGERELALQKLIGQEQKSGAGQTGVLRGIGATPTVTTKALTETSVTYEPSAALQDVLAAAQGNQKELDVNVAHWNAGVLPTETAKPQTEYEKFKTMTPEAQATFGLNYPTTYKNYLSQMEQDKVWDFITGKLNDEDTKRMAFVDTLVNQSKINLTVPTISSNINTLGAQGGITPNKMNISIRLDRQGTKDFLKDGVVDLFKYG
jgi:hypothetical protein